MWWLAPAAPTSAQAESELTLKALRQKPRVITTVLSPGGDRVAVLMRRASDIEAQSMELTWFGAGDGRQGPRLVVQGVEQLWWSRDGDALFLLAGERLGRWLVTEPRPAWIFHFDDQLEQEPWGVDGSMPRHFLVLEEPVPKRQFRLLRLDSVGAGSVILDQPTPIVDFLLDDQGEARFVKTVLDDQQVIVEQSAAGNREILRCPVLDPCDLLRFDGESLWLRSRLQGRHFGQDRLQLVALDLATLEGHRIHADPRQIGELGSTIWNPDTDRPLLVGYETDRTRFYGVSPEVEVHAERLRRDFAASVLKIQADNLESPWLLEERAPNLHHARHYLYDPRQGTRREILVEERSSVPMVAGDRLAEQQPISFSASDGRTIYGYVWQPEGDSRRAPMVAMVHGGPWSRSRFGFNGMAQLLVDRGYVVFQPNFRGSSGFGEGYLRAGKSELSRGKVQQDILDGIDYLADSGIGDRHNVAIMGHSYGGFAALGAAAFHGDRYRAAIATAAPIDLVRSFRDLSLEHEGRHGLPLSLWVKELLVDLDDSQAVTEEREKSPEANIELTSIPVLLVAGAKDEKVSVVDVKYYASRLQELGKPVSFWLDEEAGHQFERPHMADAMTWLGELFLAEHLGGRQLPIDDPEVRAFINSRAVLRAPGAMSSVASPRPASH